MSDLTDEEIISMFSKRLRQLRDERGLTLIQLSAYTGLGVTTISQYENGKRAPHLIQLIKLSEFFSVSVNYLIGTTESR